MADQHPRRRGRDIRVDTARGSDDLINRTGLTAAEAADRGARIGRTAYHIQIDLTSLAANGTFRVATALDFEARELGRPVWLDLIAEGVQSLQHNGCQLDVNGMVGPERIVLPTVAHRNTVTVRSRHVAGDQAAGLNRSVDAADGEVYAWTQFQPFDARRMVPCFDQPDLRATFSLEVLASADWTCVSNSGALDGPVTTGAGARRWRFADTPPIPVYLLAMCAGPFAVRRTCHSGIGLGLLARRSLEDALDRAAPELFSLTAHGLDKFGSDFGMPYPGDSYDQVFLPDQPGAMENLGCVTWNDRALHRTEPTLAERSRRALVLLHELSHQWFGDLVSPRWWNDLWLSESFADWAAMWALRSYPGLQSSTGTGAGMYKAEALQADQLPGAHPVSRAVPDMAAVEANFDAITYHKGACLLHELVELIGEQTFLDGLRSYFNRFAWSPATIDGLLDELDIAANVDVRRWAAEWLRTSGVNTVRAQVERDGARSYRRVTLQQSADQSRPLLRSHRVRLRAFDVVDGALVAAGATTAQISGPATEVPGLAGTTAADLLLVDEQDSGFFKARLDADSLRVLLAHGHTLPGCGPRAALRQIVGDMLFDAELSAPAAVRLLARCLITETDDEAFAATAHLAIAAAQQYTAPERRVEFCAVIADACLRLVDDSGTEPVTASAAWSALARSASSPGQLTALERALEACTLPGSIRWDAVTRLVALGGDHALVDAERRLDPDPDSWVAVEAARVAARSPAAKDRGLSLMLDPAGVPSARIAQLAAGLWQPLQHAELADVALSFLAGLPDAVALGGTARAIRLARWGFPTSGLSPALGRTAAGMSSDESLPLAVRTILADQAAVVDRMLRTAGLPG